MSRMKGKHDFLLKLGLLYNLNNVAGILPLEKLFAQLPSLVLAIAFVVCTRPRVTFTAPILFKDRKLLQKIRRAL